MILIEVTKIKDLKFDGQHPNHINNGFKEVGYIENLPKVGKPFVMYSIPKITIGGVKFYTSTVKKVTKGTFTTLNSVYKFKIIDPVVNE